MRFFLNIQSETAHISSLHSQINIACAAEVPSRAGAEENHRFDVMPICQINDLVNNR